MSRQHAYNPVLVARHGSRHVIARVQQPRAAARHTIRSKPRLTLLDSDPQLGTAAHRGAAERAALRSANPDDGPVAEIERVLIPIDATERSRWAIRHVLDAHQAGVKLEVHLLFVAEPITRWEVLRFRTQAEIAKFQAERAQWLLADAAQSLRGAGVAVECHFRTGDISFEILDAAEQLACARVVLPRPRPRWQNLLVRDVVREVLRRARSTRVETVDPTGRKVIA